MAEVIEFPGNTTVEMDPADVLEKAKGWGLKRVVIVGEDHDGKPMFGGSTADVHFINFILDLAKKDLLARFEF